MTSAPRRPQSGGMTATIRIARPEDAAALAALKLRTFRETFLEEGFAIPYPPADRAIFETASYSAPAVAAELADPARRTWVADAGDRLLGYAQVGPCKLPHPEAGEAQGELYQLYVLREAQGMKLGKALLDAALGHLAEARPGPVWLGVWSGNDKAQAVYAARGFEKVGDYRFKVGSWYDEEYILRKDR
ncbi:GCN5-related N-acetyltransferase [Rhizorhabdus wittichii RW1]|uniref:GCN5-related N-acetyltransferase n=2 Tax=Rhizorhabdus wittichii TaxID=160791 RepID=A0A9J9HCC8_RHIWR|nr:GCN5-related N-acetyltransferase [Rhizorhabdus wittichii RW1]